MISFLRRNSWIWGEPYFLIVGYTKKYGGICNEYIIWPSNKMMPGAVGTAEEPTSYGYSYFRPTKIERVDVMGYLIFSPILFDDFGLRVNNSNHFIDGLFPINPLNLHSSPSNMTPQTTHLSGAST